MTLFRWKTWVTPFQTQGYNKTSHSYPLKVMCVCGVLIVLKIAYIHSVTSSRDSEVLGWGLYLNHLLPLRPTNSYRVGRVVYGPCDYSVNPKSVALIFT